MAAVRICIRIRYACQVLLRIFEYLINAINLVALDPSSDEQGLGRALSSLFEQHRAPSMFTHAVRNLPVSVLHLGSDCVSSLRCWTYSLEARPTAGRPIVA
jgi:hypothetical protein